jgi:hypothetical protein
MFGRRKKGPSKPFDHQTGCKILAADPGVEIPWNEVRTGYWEARCVCGTEGWHAPDANRVRVDPLDARTGRHLGQCEFASEADAAMLRVLLKVTDKGSYSWVECGACDAGWQVPHYVDSAESVGVTTGWRVPG